MAATAGFDGLAGSANPMFEYQFRMILIGDSTVGKSSLLRNFCEGVSAEGEADPTVGVDFYTKLIEIRPNVRIKLQLWDTAGQERFRSITRAYYRNSVGALLLYDIAQFRTFDHITDWLMEARSQIDMERAVFLLVGCKKDLEGKREVETIIGEEFSKINDMDFIETSAKTGENVEQAFFSIAEKIYDLIQTDKLKIEEGWDGVKRGYFMPTNELSNDNFNGESEFSADPDHNSSCCS
ncbi:hypothetical protein SNEBB_008458 [Seison nebaliae]|nr:hypothetical protein SNEBB_008458 [Seison nebaliae]